MLRGGISSGRGVCLGSLISGGVPVEMGGQCQRFENLQVEPEDKDHGVHWLGFTPRMHPCGLV